jgi:DNA polymerase-3 subunit delta
VPGLALATLRKHIQSKDLGPIYVLYGDDVRLMEQIIDAIEATIDPADRPFAVARLYAGEEGGSPLAIADAANVFPMLGDRRLVIVLRAERFLKPKRAQKAGESDATAEDDAVDAEGGSLDTTPLEAYLDNPSPTSVLVLAAAGIDRTRRLTKRLLEKAACVEFAGIEAARPAEQRDLNRQAAADVQKTLAAEGRTIDVPTAHALVERAGGDVSKLRDDIERLVLFTEGRSSVSRADVETVVATETLVDDWAVVNAIGDGDTARALRETALRFARGDSPHQFVGQLRWWVSAKLAPAAPERVKPAIDALLRTDLALKSSGGDDQTLVERLVIELTGKPLPRSRW